MKRTNRNHVVATPTDTHKQQTLRLRRETLRQLLEKDLHQVVGGCATGGCQF